VKIQKANLRDFRTFMRDRFPQVKYLSQINRKMALAWIKHLKDRNYSGASHNVKLAVVRGLFEQLGAEAGILSNPFAGIPYQPLNSMHRQPFSQEELERILNHADDIIRPVILTGMCTAMRRGDCCLLKWESVDLKNGFISVKTSKTGELAEIPLFPLLREELERHPQEGKYVFPEAANMYRENSYGISWRFKQALKKAEIKNTHAQRNDNERMASVKDFHSLRTTWITMALTAGVPMELVRRVTGHSTVNIVLKHYFRPGREDFRNALETALPQSMTGRTDTRKSPTEQLQELVEKADELEKDKLIEEMAKIAEQLAA
jgi:integrase